MAKINSEIKKIQFSFSKKALDAIEELARMTGAATKTEVIRNALKVYNWIVDMQDAGFVIQAYRIKDNRKIELADERFPAGKTQYHEEMDIDDSENREVDSLEGKVSVAG